jgi:hypothetical protein
MNEKPEPGSAALGLLAAVSIDVIGVSDTAALERHQPPPDSRARFLVRRQGGNDAATAASGALAGQKEQPDHGSRRPARARWFVEAGPRIDPALTGYAYLRTQRSRDVSPISDGIRRLSMRRASQVATRRSA